MPSPPSGFPYSWMTRPKKEHSRQDEGKDIFIFSTKSVEHAEGFEFRELFLSNWSRSLLDAKGARALNRAFISGEAHCVHSEGVPNVWRLNRLMSYGSVQGVECGFGRSASSIKPEIRNTPMDSMVEAWGEGCGW
jgi:hypothetical protein